MSKNHPENRSERESALELSDLFAKLEGRRPRILVAELDPETSVKYNSICSAFADLGYNVDLAPRISQFNDLAIQCLENDADILLVLGDKLPEEKHLMEVQNTVLNSRPDVVLAIMVNNTINPVNTDRQLKWLHFDPTISEFLMGKKIMDILVSSHG